MSTRVSMDKVEKAYILGLLQGASKPSGEPTVEFLTRMLQDWEPNKELIFLSDKQKELYKKAKKK